MEYIYQGQNDPLVLEIEGIEDAEVVSAVLSQFGKALKTWSPEDLDFSVTTGKLSLNLKESETLTFKKGRAVLDVKTLDENRVIFMDPVHYEVVERFNKTAIAGD